MPKSNRSPVRILESTRTPVGILLEFNNFYKQLDSKENTSNYIQTNINYIVPGCHRHSSRVVMGRRHRWRVVLGRRAVGGCWRWAVIEDGGWWWVVFAVSGVGCAVWVLVLGRPCHW